MTPSEAWFGSQLPENQEVSILNLSAERVRDSTQKTLSLATNWETGSVNPHSIRACSHYEINTPPNQIFSTLLFSTLEGLPLNLYSSAVRGVKQAPFLWGET